MGFRSFVLGLFFCSFLIFPRFLDSSPPRQIPPELHHDFTLGGRIGVSSWYINGSYSSNTPLIYTTKEIEDNLVRISNKENSYYGRTDEWLYQGIEKYIGYIKGKSVAIIGSTVPWYESIILYYEGLPTTIEYNKIISQDSRVNVMTVAEYEDNPATFDVVLSISSYEHDGLGRYGDPIDPFGDFKAMQKAQDMLNDDGIMILAVPVGRDHLFWNAHRVYGRIRLQKLLEGWTMIDSFGFSESNFNVHAQGGHQPVFVLRKNK